jgi:cell shape-determining protein MreC
MRGNYRRTSTKRWRVGFFVTAVVLFIGLIFPQLMAGVSFIVLYPFHTVSVWYKNSESILPKYLRSRVELAAEIDSLQAKIANQTGTQLSVSRLIEENKQLRALTELGTTTDRVSAKVISQPSRLSYDLLQIDKGSNNGIEIGAPVYVGIDTVIGVVVHTSPAYSFVELVTTPGFLSTAYIVGPNIFAPLEGVGGGVARVKVPQGITLTEGNLVLLPSAANGVYGEIVSIENLPTQPEQFGYVVPPITLARYSLCFGRSVCSW